MAEFNTLPDYDGNTIAQITTALGFISIVSFGFYVVFYVKSYHTKANGLSDFLTARNSASWLTVGFSMFASAVGSWVIATPTGLARFGGALAAFAYAFAAGIPLILTAFWGTNIRKKFPEILSFSDFAYQRYGRATQGIVILLSLLNMGVFVTAEYTTIYTLYKYFVGIGDLALLVVLTLATVTLCYTAYGGLPVSIITDKAQGISTGTLSLVLLIYLASTFTEENVNKALERENFTAVNFEFNDDAKGFNLTGYSNLFTLPISLVAATIFSEAFWQRSWAAKDEETLKKGAVFGFFLVFSVVSIFATPGVLLLYSQIPLDPNEATGSTPIPLTVRTFVDENRSGTIASGWGLVTVLLGTIMAVGAVDSLQNGLGSTISGAIGAYVDENKSLTIARAIVVVLNVPLIIIGTLEQNILSLFLLGNMLTLCAAFPVLIGFYPEIDFINRNIKDWTMPIGFCFNFVTVGVYGQTKLGSFANGVQFAFYDNASYEYQYFLVNLVASFISTFLLLAANEVAGRFLGFEFKVLGHNYNEAAKVLSL